MYDEQCSVCSKRFLTKVDKWNHELGVHCLKNIMWQNHTQSVREYSWTLTTGSGSNEQGKPEFKVYQSRKTAQRNTVQCEDYEREQIVQQKSQRHLENLIRCSESGRPFSKNLSLMTDCEFCPMKYLSRQALRAHEKAAHMDANEIWLCMFCTKTYISRHELRTHIVNKHPAQFHKRLSEFHNERLKTEDVKMRKTRLPQSGTTRKVELKDGQLLCELCNTVCKTFGLFSLARLTEQQKNCILNHKKSSSSQKTIRWFMRSHFPYFYKKYIADCVPQSRMTKFQQFHLLCPLKATHITRWKRELAHFEVNSSPPTSSLDTVPTPKPPIKIEDKIAIPKFIKLAPKTILPNSIVAKQVIVAVSDENK